MKKIFFGGRAGGGGGGAGTNGMNMTATIFSIHDTTLSRPLLQNVQFHENNPDGIQNREHCSFNNQGKSRKYASMSCLSSIRHIVMTCST